MGLVIFYALINWMPLLFKEACLDPQAATLISALFPLGGCRARFSGSDASCRMPWPAAYITNMFESEFPAHTSGSTAGTAAAIAALRRSSRRVRVKKASSWPTPEMSRWVLLTPAR